MPYRKAKPWGLVKPDGVASIAWGHPLSQGLIARSLVNEGGMTVLDLARNAKGALSGPTWKSGKFGKSLSLDSAGAVITYSPGIAVTAGSNFTFSMWANVSAWQGANPGIWRDVAVGTYFNIFQGSTGLPWIRWAGADILKPASGYAVSLNRWTHLVFTVRSSTDACFYADGVLRHTATHATVTGAFSITVVGQQNANTERVQGFYDNISVYRRALTATEVAQLYAEPFGDIVPARRRIINGSAAAGRTAALAVTESNDAAAATAALAIAAQLAKTEVNDSATSAGAALIAAAVTASEESDTSSAGAALPIAATLTTAEQNDSIGATASLPLVASVLITEAGDAIVVSGALAIAAALGMTEANDSISAAAAHDGLFVMPDSDRLHSVTARDRVHSITQRARTHAVTARSRIHRA